MGRFLGAAGGKSFHVDNDYRWWDLWGGLRGQINASTVAERGARSLRGRGAALQACSAPGVCAGERWRGSEQSAAPEGASGPFPPPPHPGQHSQSFDNKVENSSSSPTGG